MGLIDRDYMKDQHRQRPFSPPPKRSGTSTLAMVLIFIAILFALYKIADWKLQQRTAQPAPQPSAAKTGSPAIEPVTPATQAFAPVPHPQQDTPGADAATQLVTKCVTKGKTSYGDGPCAQGAAVSQIRTRSDHNLMAAVRPERINAAPAEERTSPRGVVAQNSPVADVAATKKAECQFLDARIAELDALSRQPQSAQTHDWIRDERKKARDRQFRLSCG